ncbi:restriction endonuclease subunit S [Microcystis aeruginosa]|uniref:restriction endonuclease subunit S n=1 Tax=Microcystis aeruginosa TaxID=1126 RepID=UPI001D13711B|nr:restriction endonuclease subunit S [Microcystis aeruginosa]
MNRDLLSGEYKRFPKHWEVIPFTKAFKDMTGGQTKIPKGDYLESGDIPIIDQGQDLIGGYTNERQAVCDIRLPCVVFGDHTKIFKFVTKPFALGADGVKVLSEANNIDPKFAYYFLNTLNLPDVGYSRHFRFLKRTFFPLPPLEEQRRIAAILDKADGVRRKRKEAIRLTEELLRSTFLEMFGDPVTNPKGWEICELQNVCNRVTDGTHQPPNWADEGIPFIFVSNIVNGEIDFKVSKHITEESWFELTSRCPIEINDILYTTVGSYGNAALVRTKNRFCFQRHIAHIKPDSRSIEPEFLLGMMQSDWTRQQADKQARGVAQKTLNLRELKKFTIFTPPIEEQKKYVKLRQGVEKQLSYYRSALEQSENLFNSLLQRAFRGEL